MSTVMDELVVATSAAVGQVVGTFVTFPLDIVKTRQQATTIGSCQKETLVEGLRRLIVEDGISGVLALFPSKGIQQGLSRFTYYYLYQSVINRYKGFAGVEKLGTVANLLLGYLAGLLNTVFLSPLETVSTRVLASKSPLTMSRATADVIKESGLAGFYYGWSATYYSSCNPAIQNTAYDQIKLLLLRGRAVLGFAESFWLGAFTKALATFLTYPPSRVKSLIQNMPSVDKDGNAVADPSVFGMMVTIHEQEGTAGLYSGLTATLVKGVLQAAFMLAVKERLDHATRVAFGMA
jgi:hypothetical protein